MNPINYSDIFDFTDGSEPEKFVKAVSAMEQALADLQERAKKVSAESAKVLKANAAAAAAAAEQVANATDKEIESLSKKAAALKKSTEQAKESKQAADEQAKSLGDLQKYLNELKKAYDVNANNVEEMNRKIAETTQQIKINQQAIREAQAANEQATKIDIKQLKTYNEKAAALNQLRKRYKELNPDIAEQRAEMGKTLVAIQKLDKELKGIDASMGNFQRNVGNYRSALAGAISKLPGAGNFAGLISGAGGAAAAVGLLATAVVGTVTTIYSRSKEALIQFQQLEKGLRAVSGSVLETQTNINFLFSTADRLGLSVSDLSDTFKSFMAAARGTSLQGEQARQVFETLSLASSKLGLSNEATNRALTALQQMMSKGKVQAEELRGQFGEALPGGFQIAARAMGVTAGELSKMLEKGEVLASDLLPKLANQLTKEYGGNAGELGITGLTNQLNNAFDRLFTSIGKRLEPLLTTFLLKSRMFVLELASIFQTEEEEQQIAAGRLKESLQKKFKDVIDKKDVVALTSEINKLTTSIREAEASIANKDFVTVAAKRQAEATKKRIQNMRLEVVALQSILADVGSAQQAAEIAASDAAAKAAAERAKEAEKAAKERAQELKKLRKELQDFLDKNELEFKLVFSEANLQKELEAAIKFMQDEASKAAELAAKRRQILKLDTGLQDEIAESPFAAFDAKNMQFETFDNFFDYQLQLIDNNRAIADSFSEIGNTLSSIFGDNPFTAFIDNLTKGYTEFLKLQELQVKLKQKDTVATASNTAAAAKNAAAQGAVAVTKTAAQSGLASIATVPAILAIIASAVGLIKSLFSGFEEGTEFLGKDNPRAPLGKDSIPIIAAKGERILPYRLNKELAGISNEELVKLAKLGAMQGDFSSVPTATVVVNKTESSKPEMFAKAIANEISKLPVAVNVWDESGYHSHTQKINKLRQVNKRWFA
jgi:tape measure domain-containing protein